MSPSHPRDARPGGAFRHNHRTHRISSPPHSRTTSPHLTSLHLTTSSHLLPPHLTAPHHLISSPPTAPFTPPQVNRLITEASPARVESAGKLVVAQAATFSGSVWLGYGPGSQVSATTRTFP
jgi:hypothetical protein